MARTKTWIGFSDEIGLNDAAPDAQTFQIASGSPTTTFGHLFIRGWWLNSWRSGTDTSQARTLEWYIYVGAPNVFLLPQSQNLLAAGHLVSGPPYFDASGSPQTIVSSNSLEIKEETHGQRTVGDAESGGVYLQVFKGPSGSTIVGASVLKLLVRVLRFTD